MLMNIQTVLSFSLLIIIISGTIEANSVVDFCVADPSLPNGPAGYSCKNPSTAVPDDFFFSLATKGNTSNVFRSALTPGVSPIFPGVNGLGTSIVRVDVDVGGVVPMHTHPAATELIIVVQGTIRAGFMSTTSNQVYIKIINVGESMVFPRGLLHFQINVGPVPALVYAFFNSDNPGLQITDYAFFQNNLRIDDVARTTYIVPIEVLRLKKLFGGTIQSTVQSS